MALRNKNNLTEFYSLILKKKWFREILKKFITYISDSVEFIFLNIFESLPEIALNSKNCRFINKTPSTLTNLVQLDASD